MKLPKHAVTYIVIAVLFSLVLALMLLGRSPTVIASHNRIMRSLNCRTNIISISTYGEYGNQGSNITVSDAEVKQRLVSNLHVDDLFQLTGVSHSCAGNITVRFVDRNDRREVRYDHGVGIYLVTGTDQHVGFIKLSNENCNRLNAELIKLGLSPKEIGIE